MGDLSVFDVLSSALSKGLSPELPDVDARTHGVAELSFNAARRVP